MQRMIQFLKPNRYGIHVGDTRLFDYGPAELLVQRGIASWVTEPVAKAEPVAEEDVSTKDTTKRRKRSETTEE